MRLGAAMAQMDEMVGNQMTLPPGSGSADVKPAAQRLTAAPHAILVDQSGVRYMNEGGSYMAYCKGMLERNKTVPAVPSWAIFDSQFMRKYMLAGTMPGSKKPQRWYRRGLSQARPTRSRSWPARSRRSGDAASDGRPLQRLRRAGNRDEDFHRGDRAYDRWLGDPTPQAQSRRSARSSKAPFYAVPIYPGDVGTYGGVVTDEHARVLREDGSVIDGLYATGVSTASVMGRIYPGAGSSVGPSLHLGLCRRETCRCR